MLKPAIAQMELEIEQLAKAKPGTTGWAIRQAKSIGLSFLRTADVRGISDPEVFDTFRKMLRRDVIKDATQDALAVELAKPDAPVGAEAKPE